MSKELTSLPVYPFGTYCDYNEAKIIIADKDAEVSRLQKVNANLQRQRNIVGEYANEYFNHECGWINLFYFTEEQIKTFKAIHGID